jgi:phosphoglycolate phosphatase
MTERRTGKGTRPPAGRQLVLFDLRGVLVERGGSRRLPGAAEALAQFRHSGDAVLSLLTAEDESSARTRAIEVGVDRYLDLAVAAYRADTGSPVATARERAQAVYGGEFEVVVVTADSEADVAGVRADADVVIAVATGTSTVPQLRAAGADHVLTNLVDLVALARDANRAAGASNAARH